MERTSLRLPGSLLRRAWYSSMSLPHGIVPGFNPTVLLLQSDRLILVLENVPVRALALFEALVPAVLHGLPGGEVLEDFKDFLVRRVRRVEVVEKSLCLVDFVGGGIGPAEVARESLVCGRALHAESRGKAPPFWGRSLQHGPRRARSLCAAEL